MTSLSIAAANLTPDQGILAHNRLAEHQIKSRLENLDLVTWLWHLSIAIHGVRVVVAKDELKAAVDILAQAVDTSRHEGATRQCGECSETIPHDWDVCWRCGTDVNGTRDKAFRDETIQRSCLLSHAESVDFLGAWLLLAATMLFLAPALSVALALMCVALAARDRPSPHSFTSQVESADSNMPDEVLSDCGDETARRAMASAMFGLGWFAPLTVYSLWILCNSDELPCSTKGLVWRRAAWTLNAIAIGTLILVGLLIAIIANEWHPTWRISQIVTDLIEASTGLSTSRI